MGQKHGLNGFPRGDLLAPRGPPALPSCLASFQTSNSGTRGGKVVYEYLSRINHISYWIPRSQGYDSTFLKLRLFRWHRHISQSIFIVDGASRTVNLQDGLQSSRCLQKEYLDHLIDYFVPSSTSTVAKGNIVARPGLSWYKNIL